MSEENQSELTAEEKAEELQALKARANSMGLSFHPNIGADTLRQKIADAVKDEGVEETKEPEAEASKVKGVVITPREAANKLHRVRITCMDPSKKQYKGDLFTVGNSAAGTIKKYIAFDVPWHVPHIILNVMKRRQYQTFAEDSNGNKRGRLVKAYAIEYLDSLSQKELTELKQRQLMAAGKS